MLLLPPGRRLRSRVAGEANTAARLSLSCDMDTASRIDANNAKLKEILISIQANTQLLREATARLAKVSRSRSA